MFDFLVDLRVVNLCVTAIYTVTGKYISNVHLMFGQSFVSLL